MAGDKLRDGFPVAVDFAAGEQPSDTKLDGWANQTQNALKALEQAVGDVLDQTKALGSGNKLSNRDLQIGNIGRLLGPASMLNPQIIGDLNIIDFTVSVPVGIKEFILPHPPMVGGSPIVIAFSPSGPATRFNIEKFTPDALAAAGDYYVDYNTGRVFTYSLTLSGDQATYDYDSIGDSFSNASLNIIPDSNQTSERCNVTTTVGGFFVETPYIKYDQDGILATDGSDPNYSDGASTHNTQRAQLPSFLSVLSIGDLIPAGFIRLFDHTIETIVDGAIFRYQNQSKVKVENVQLTVSSSQYSLITIGAPLSEILHEVRKKQREHTHSGEDGGSIISHANLFDNIYDGNELWGAADSAFTEKGYVTSVVSQNYHPQYLMRSGYRAAKDPKNSDNAMRGEILMGSTSPLGNDYANITADSRSVFFGNEAGPRLRYKFTYDALQLASKSLMADLNISVGRSSSVNANTKYFGFGTDPANNNLFLDEASSTYKFKNDGVTTGTIMEAGHYVAGAVSNPRYYFNAIGSNNYLQHTGSGVFAFFSANTQTASQVSAGTLRTMSNQVIFGDGNDYLSWNDTTNTFAFVGDASVNGAFVQCGTFRSLDSRIDMPDSTNRIYKTSNDFYFQAGTIVNSVLNAGRLQLFYPSGSAVLNATQITDLTDGGNTTIHRHNYGFNTSAYTIVYRASGDFALKTYSGLSGYTTEGVALSGWEGCGNIGNNDMHVYPSGSNWSWSVSSCSFCNCWDDSMYIWVTSSYSRTNVTF